MRILELLSHLCAKIRAGEEQCMRNVRMTVFYKM